MITDSQLGNLISNFANYLFQLEMTIEIAEKKAATKVQQIVYDMIRKSLKGFQNSENSVLKHLFSSILNSLAGNCGSFMSPMMQESFETYLDMMRHSQVGNTTKTPEERNTFVQRYFINNPFFTEATLRTNGFVDHMGMVPFCQYGSMSNLNTLLPKQMRECKDFDLIVTPKGFCYAFNSLSIDDDIVDRDAGVNFTNVL